MNEPLTRTPDDRVIAGVCGGLADRLGVDPTIVRVLAVVGTLLGAGSLVVAYVVAWALMPKRSADHPVWPAATDPLRPTASAPAPR